MSNKIYLGSTNLGTGKIRLGANDVSAIYLGANQVYPPSSPTPTDPDMLRFTAQQANSTVALTPATGINLTLYKSTDGSNFSSWDGSAVTLSNIGDTLWVYGTNQTISTSSSSYTKFVMTRGIAAAGDVTYLLQNGGLTTLTSNYAFACLFKDCTTLTTAPTLPATTLTQGCYYEMFAGCTSLTTAPTLPATTVPQGAYNSMFAGCSSLTTAPALPATTLGDYCYNMMFQYCTNLTTAPQLPATTVPAYGYKDMFRHCTSLTTAPALPATTLNSYCYENMFFECTSLTTAPDLMAQTIPAYGYHQMFNRCSSLNSVTCLATDISATDCTLNWLYGVSATGTFTRNSNMSSWTTGASGIPSGWTVVTPQLPQVATPTITVETTYAYCEYDLAEYADGSDDVTIATSTADATIYYRQYSQSEVYDQENDSWSTEWVEDTSGWTLYNGVVSNGGYYLDNIGTNGEYKIEAKAVKTGYTDSEIATEIYTSSTDEYSTSCYPPTDCNDCANWEECGYGCYEECADGSPCQTDCSDWENMGYESYEDCDCSENGNCPEEEEPVEEEPEP